MPRFLKVKKLDHYDKELTKGNTFTTTTYVGTGQEICIRDAETLEDITVDSLEKRMSELIDKLKESDCKSEREYVLSNIEECVNSLKSVNDHYFQDKPQEVL